MTAFKKVAGTRCLGQVNSRCQNFIGQTLLPPEQQYCACGSRVTRVTVNDVSAMVVALAAILAVTGGAAYVIAGGNRAVGVSNSRHGARAPVIEDLISQGDYRAVVKAGEKALRERPEDPVLLNNVGVASIKIGNFRSARQYLDRAAALRPNDPYFRYNQACVAAQTGNKLEAVKLLRMACQFGLPPAGFRQDADLYSLRGYKPFEELVASESCQPE